MDVVFKIKHLDLISAPEVDYAQVMREVSGLTKWRFWNVFKFIKLYKSVYNQVEILRQIDPAKVEESENCSIKRPAYIDLITFSAMMELVSMFAENQEDKGMGELMIDTIAIVCFSANRKEDFDMESEAFISFREEVANCELVSAMGLYRWIGKALDESQEMWNKAFFEVETTDEDFVQAGGHRMGQFSVLMTLKTICNDFNVDYKQAAQMPYGMTQANSLARATEAHIRQIMTASVQAKMKAERERNV